MGFSILHAVWVRGDEFRAHWRSADDLFLPNRAGGLRQLVGSVPADADADRLAYRHVGQRSWTLRLLQKRPAHRRFDCLRPGRGATAGPVEFSALFAVRSAEP